MITWLLSEFQSCSVFVGTNHDLPKWILKVELRSHWGGITTVLLMGTVTTSWCRKPSKTVPFAGHLWKDLQYVLDRMRPGCLWEVDIMTKSVWSLTKFGHTGNTGTSQKWRTYPWSKWKDLCSEHLPKANQKGLGSNVSVEVQGAILRWFCYGIIFGRTFHQNVM